MAISKIILNGVTQMDVTQDTVASNNLLSGYTATGADGTTVTGQYNPASPTLQTKSKTYTPTTSQQTESVTADSGYDGLSAVNVTVNAVPSGTVADVVTNIPIVAEASFDQQTGLFTAIAELDSLINPITQAGYVNVNPETELYGASTDTYQLPTQSATTITPTESSQTAVSAGKYTTGAVTVGAISSTYVGTGITRRSSTDLTASGATVTVPSGYYSAQASKAVASGSATAAATISGTAATVSTGTNTLTLSKTVSNTPQVTAGYVASGTAGNSSVSLTANVTTKGATTYNTSATDQTIASGTYLTGAQTIRGVTTSNLTADNIKNGVTVTVGDSADADRVLSVTGTYSGGTSKNAQAVQGTTRTTSSTLTAIGAEMTVSKTGTYDVYWSAFRSNTSSQYTFATKLYINGTGYGSEQTTWSNHQQNVHLSNVLLTINDKIRVYGRESRGSSYYMYAGTLTIIEA